MTRVHPTVIKKILRAWLQFPTLADAKSLCVLLDVPINKVRYVLDNKVQLLKVYTKEELLATRFSNK